MGAFGSRRHTRDWGIGGETAVRRERMGLEWRWRWASEGDDEAEVGVEEEEEDLGER